MIFGVTVDEEGRPLKRMIVSRKLGVGLPPNDTRNYPVRYDHFITSKRTGKKGEFELDKEFTAHLGKIYGEPLMELDVILRSNNREEIFRSEYAWRTQDRSNAMLCHGDGHDAVRKWKAFTPEERLAIGGTYRDNDEIEIKTCGDQAGKPICPHLAAKKCKPSGDLYFMFPEDPIFGSMATLHTGGWEGVRRLAASLALIEKEIEPYGGQLNGMRLKIVAQHYPVRYQDPKTKQERVDRQLAFHLEFRSKDHRKLLPTMVHEARLLAESMGEAIDIEPISDSEIADEFYPTDEQKEQQQAESGERRDEEKKSANVLDRVVADHRPSAVVVPTTAFVPASTAALDPNIL